MAVWIDATPPRKIRRFRLVVGEESITVQFGRDLPPDEARERILQALDTMLPPKEQTQ